MFYSSKLKLLLFIKFSIFFIIVGKAQNPNWQKPVAANYTFTANVVSTLKLNGIVTNNIEDRVAFFVGNELRGLSKPTLVGPNNYIHFVTLYSNAASEMMDVKIYHKLSDEVYDLAAPLEYKVQSIYGNLESPFEFNAYSNNNAPIAILDVDDQQTIKGLAFNPIDMADYLIQPDPFGVEWSFDPNSNLNAYFIGSVLYVEGNGNFIGQTSLTIRATELTTIALDLHSSNVQERNVQSQNQTAETTINFEITNLYAGPAWNNIPNQGIVKGNQFETFDLDDFEYNYGGQFLQYDYAPIVKISANPVPIPTWTFDEKYQNTMAITASINFTPKYKFNHVNDVLIGIVNGEIHSLTRKDTISNLYYIAIGGASNGDQIIFKFYSGLKQEILTLSNAISYSTHGVVGSPDEPFLLDFSPLLPLIQSSGFTSIAIIDTSWIGTQDFIFKAADGFYPNYLHAEETTSFCIVNQLSELSTLYKDEDGDGLGNPNISIQACVGADGYVTNDDDCDDGNAVDPLITISISENSGSSPNDGNVCLGAQVIMSASGGVNYEWSNGQSGATNEIFPIETQEHSVTVTHAIGCKGAKSVTINVEGTIVNSEANEGNGSLRNVLECIADGGTVTYNQPSITKTFLTGLLLINKNVTIKGLSISSPEISIDYSTPTSGIKVIANKKLILDYIDLKLINGTGYNTFIGEGSVDIKSITKIKL